MSEIVMSEEGAVDRSRKSTAKRNIRVAIGVFVALMAGLTLFSSTLLNYSLAQVTLAKPAPGALEHFISGTGTVEAAKTADIYVNTGWPVGEVTVKSGDRVKAGDTLVSFDTEAVKDALADARTRYQQRSIDLQKLRNQYRDIVRAGEDPQEKELVLDMRQTELDLQLMRRQIARDEKQLKEFSAVKASADGQVVELNAVKGAPVQAGRPVVKIADVSQGMTITFVLEAVQAERIEVGDRADISFEALANARVPAVVKEIRNAPVEEPSGNGRPPAAQTGKEVVLSLKDDRLLGGETGELALRKKSPPQPILIPNAAIREDAHGSFVLLLKERKGALGSEYYVQKLAVRPGDSDDSNTAIGKELMPSDRVVVSGSKPVADGDRVLLADSST